MKTPSARFHAHGLVMRFLADIERLAQSATESGGHVLIDPRALRLLIEPALAASLLMRTMTKYQEVYYLKQLEDSLIAIAEAQELIAFPPEQKEP